MPAPLPQAERTPEERLADVERLIAHIFAKARAHPVGRKVLAYLGLS